MTENIVKLVNEVGETVGKDHKTGETVPIELGETITESLNIDRVTNNIQSRDSWTEEPVSVNAPTDYGTILFY